ncbi:thiamine-binding protein [Candidatus Bathyarchaeota archaeon]|nr:thiamine-binding protein [Candidatus Bathyarchaeota archaeon]
MSRFVRLAIDELKKTGLKTVSGPMGTSVEAASLNEILNAAKAAHEAVVRAGGGESSLRSR